MTFDPTKHGFLKLDFTFPGGVPVFERSLDGIDQKTHSKMRLNCYLSQDGDFVCVWDGLIDAYMTGVSLGFGDDPTFDFSEQYEENLFRGYIADDVDGAVIIKALRLENRPPNTLIVPPSGKLECRLLQAD